MSDNRARRESGGIAPLALMWMVVGSVFVWSAIRPHDYFTWILEVLPAIIGAVVLATTYSKFKLTTLVYVLIGLHMIVLMIGGHYTYAEVPLFNWIRDTFETGRNSYDKVGHFAQGFVPAIIAREFLLRKSPLKRGKLLFFIVVCICLAISAAYELVEWGVSEASGSAGDAFLGTQGDIWDTQKDMATALVGAVTALLTLSGLHDRALSEVAQALACRSSNDVQSV
jgi:putative membrane protein